MGTHHLFAMGLVFRHVALEDHGCDVDETVVIEDFRVVEEFSVVRVSVALILAVGRWCWAILREFFRD